MDEKILFGFDAVFAFCGCFWAGVAIYVALSNSFDFQQWCIALWLTTILLYPFIRKTVEVLLEKDWSEFKSGNSFRNRTKKRWEY